MFFKHPTRVTMPVNSELVHCFRLADKQCSKSLLSSSPPNSTADIDRDKLEQKDVFSFFVILKKLLFDKTM